DLNVRLQQMHAMLRVLAASNIELTLDPGEDTGLVMVDPIQLEQVVLNLVMNARDAIVERGKIILRTSAAALDKEFATWGVAPRPGPYVRLDEIDTGAGMNPLSLSRAFDPFYTTKEAGTGLGLATVFGIVKQSGGYVWPTSTSSKGTTFSVYLPRYEATEADLAAMASTAPATESGHGDGAASRAVELPPAHRRSGPTGTPVLRLVPGGPSKEARPGTRPLDMPRAAPAPRLTIMLVDDDEAVRDMIRRTLERQHHTVLDAASGEQALQLNRMFNEHIDLLITDIRMPGMTGLDLRDTFVALRPSVHVLFISGHADEFMRGELRDHQTPFLGKPFTMEQMEQAVQRAMATPPKS
ncbi:MAG: response regulator, partial [Gemmatimonadaceae bacterium]